MTSGSLRSWRDQRGSTVLAVEPREEWVQVNLNFSLAASPLASRGGSAAKRVPRTQEKARQARLQGKRIASLMA